MHWVQLVQLLVFLAAGLGLSKLASASFDAWPACTLVFGDPARVLYYICLPLLL